MPGKGKPFQKGHKLSKGRPRVTEEEKILRKLTKSEFAEITSLMLRGDVGGLKALQQDSKTSVLKAMASSVALNIVKKGSADDLDKFLNRIIGKVKEEVEVSGNAVQVIVGLPKNGSEKPKDGK